QRPRLDQSGTRYLRKTLVQPKWLSAFELERSLSLPATGRTALKRRSCVASVSGQRSPMGNAVTSKDAVQASLAVPSMKWRVKALPNAAQRKTATLASRPSMWLRRKFSIKLLMISAPTFRRSVHQGVTKELYE